MKFVYISIIIVMLTFIGVGLFYLVISNDSNATHISLKEADMPKLIPVSAFYADTKAAWNFQPSHDGAFVANYNSDFGKRVIEVRKRGETGLFTKIKTDEIYDYRWHSLTNALNVGVKMQSDILDAANWAINEGIADPDNIAVMGSSYGGYSSALEMTRDAGLFKAGISEVAVTDILYQMDNNPFAWGLYLDVMKRYFGDPENEEDRKLMRERSPITHAANASDPILLMHGKLDRRVGFEQTEEFVRALNAADKNVSVHYFEKEGHGYERWQSRVQRARIIENFLAQHIGGRNGNFDWSELAAEYF